MHKSTLILDDIEMTLLTDTDLYREINKLINDIEKTIENIVEAKYQYITNELEFSDIGVKVEIIKEVCDSLSQKDTILDNNNFNEIMRKSLYALYDILKRFNEQLEKIYLKIEEHNKLLISYFISVNVDKELTFIKKNLCILESRLNLAMKLIS